MSKDKDEGGRTKAESAEIKTGQPLPAAKPGGALQDTRKSADPTEKPAEKPTRGRRGDEDVDIDDKDGKKKPKFGTAKKADADGPVPRVLDPNDRSPGNGLKRFKVRADHYAGVFQPSLYILAADADEAEEHYLEVGGTKAMYDRLKKSVGKDKEADVGAPVLNTVELPD